MELEPENVSPTTYTCTCTIQVPCTWFELLNHPPVCGALGYTMVEVTR